MVNLPISYLSNHVLVCTQLASPNIGSWAGLQVVVYERTTSTMLMRWWNNVTTTPAGMIGLYLSVGY